MELFKITCDSCASKLKVSNASAIGQVLGCPKCQNMIRVAPPDDWEMPEEIRLELARKQAERQKANQKEKAKRRSKPTADTQSRDLSSMEFGDIDDVIAASVTGKKTPKQQSRPPKPTKAGSSQNPNRPRKKQSSVKSKQPSSKKSQTAKSQTAKPATNIGNPYANNDDLVLPNDQWTAGASQKRRRLTAIIAAVVGGLLLLTAIATAVIANWPAEKAPDVVADNDIVPAPDSTNDTDAEPEPPETDPDPPKPEAGSDTAPGEEIKQPDFEPTAENSAATNPPSGEPSSSDPPPVLPSDQEADGTSKKQAPIGGSPNLQNLGGPDLGTGLDETLDPTQPASLSEITDSKIGDLFQDAGTSATEIKELAASFREQQLVGQSRYYIEKPKVGLDEKAFSKLSQPCASAQYVDQPLFAVVNDIARWTGVPISFDSAAIRDGQIDIGQKISLNQQDTDFEALLRKALQSAQPKLELTYDGTGPATIAPIEFDLNGKPTMLDLPNLENPDAEKIESLTATLKKVVTPDVWRNETVQTNLTVQEGKFVVDATAPLRSRVQIARFVEGWNLSKAAVGTDNTPPELLPLFGRAEPLLAKAFDVDDKYPLSLEVYFEKIYAETGAKIIVDWPSLVDEGWTPTARVPGNIVEASLEDFLKQICRAMSVTYRVVDETTIEITTYNSAAQKTDFEAYPVAKILKDKYSPKQLLGGLQTALGLEVETQINLRVELDAECQCLFVYAPQFVHRQIDAILQTLK